MLEEHAAFTRTGTDGVAQIATRGLIAAEFEHWDSRAGDPNLHAHVAVSSKVMGIDGAWRALDGRPLHSAAVAISETYNTSVFTQRRAAPEDPVQPRANYQKTRMSDPDVKLVPTKT